VSLCELAQFVQQLECAPRRERIGFDRGDARSQLVVRWLRLRSLLRAAVPPLARVQAPAVALANSGSSACAALAARALARLPASSCAM
jgi:hypothetical protein